MIPILYLIAGPNGSGKSTFARELISRLGGSLPFINTDDIARELGDWNHPSNQFQAGREALRRIKRLLAARTSFVHETTLSGFAQFAFAAEARGNGWFVDFTYIFVSDWTLSADRVAARVARGGHDVPLADLERRYARSLENFWSMIHLSSEWDLLDNSGETYAAIASGTPDQWIVYDHATFQALEAYRRA